MMRLLAVAAVVLPYAMADEVCSDGSIDWEKLSAAKKLTGTSPEEAIKMFGANLPSDDTQHTDRAKELADMRFAFAKALRKAGEHEKALEQVDRAKAVGRLASVSELELEGLMAVLEAEEVAVKQCLNHIDQAVALGQSSLDRTLKLVASGVYTFDELRRSMGTLIQLLKWQGSQDEAKKVAEQGISLGLWKRADQYPGGRFVEGIESKPWPPATHLVNMAKHTLKNSYPAIARDWESLKDKAVSDKYRQRECLQEKGEWFYYPLVGDGVQECDSEASRAACNFRDAAMATYPDLIIIPRMGFSIVSPGTHIRPHCGGSNDVVKLHLGVAVGDSCSALTVGGLPQYHAQGQVLYFDDSFEHEANMTCSETRVVLQVVLDYNEYLRK